MCRLAAGWHWVSLLKDNRAYVFREKEKSYWYNNIMPGRQPCLCNPLWAQCPVVAPALFPAEKWLWFAWSRTLSWLTALQKETACVAAPEARGVHLRGEGIGQGLGCRDLSMCAPPVGQKGARGIPRSWGIPRCWWHPTEMGCKGSSDISKPDSIVETELDTVSKNPGFSLCVFCCLLATERPSWFTLSKCMMNVRMFLNKELKNFTKL